MTFASPELTSRGKPTICTLSAQCGSCHEGRSRITAREQTELANIAHLCRAAAEGPTADGDPLSRFHLRREH